MTSSISINAIRAWRKAIEKYWPHTPEAPPDRGRAQPPVATQEN